MTSTPDDATAAGCPVVEIDYRHHRPAFWHFASLNEVREQARFSMNTAPRTFWMVSRYDDVKEALQRPDVFTNEVTSALQDPATKVRLIPQNAVGRDHVKYRQVLNPWFSPGSVKRIEPMARARCIEMIEELAPRGVCDLAVDFAMLYPTEVFLAILGLPTEDGRVLLPLVEGMFRRFFGDESADTATVVDQLQAYYKAAVDDRIATPRDPTTDFITYLLQTEADGEPLSYDEVLTLCFTIMLAGLDTTRSELGYMFHHLATHEGDRRTLVDHPELIPDAVEEFCRLYGLLIQDGRFVAEDIDFHGCPMKKGDIVWLGLAAADRDPRRFEEPDEFRLDREFTKHLAFAAGAHRCLGAHLARSELTIALEEWLARIPDFRLADGDELEERGGQLMLRRVPLAWDV